MLVTYIPIKGILKVTESSRGIPRKNTPYYHTVVIIVERQDGNSIIHPKTYRIIDIMDA